MYTTRGHLGAISPSFSRLLSLSFMFEILRRYLQSQAILWPMLVSSAVTAVANVALNSFFLYVLDLGFEGTALASALSQWIMAGTCLACIAGARWHARRQGAYSALSVLTPAEAARAGSHTLLHTWPAWSWEVLDTQRWGEFLRLALPGSASLFIESESTSSTQADAQRMPR